MTKVNNFGGFEEKYRVTSLAKPEQMRTVKKHRGNSMKEDKNLLQVTTIEGNFEMKNHKKQGEKGVIKIQYHQKLSTSLIFLFYMQKLSTVYDTQSSKIGFGPRTYKDLNFVSVKQSK